MTRWHPVCGADDISHGPKKIGYYEVTIEPKDAIDCIDLRHVATLFWDDIDGFDVPLGYRAIAWRAIPQEPYDGPTPFATAEARREFLKGRKK